MKKADLIAEVHQSIDGELTKKKVGEIINALFDSVGGAIAKEGRFSAPGFGTFTVVVLALAFRSTFLGRGDARNTQNPPEH